MRGPLIFSAVIIIASSTVYADQMYFGGGAVQMWIDSTSPAIGSQSAPGYQFIAGYRDEMFGFDLTGGGVSIKTGEVTDIYYPPDSADYTILNLELRFYPPLKHNVNFSPWIGAGVGWHTISWDSYWYFLDGIGPSFSAGIDFRLFWKAWLRCAVKYHKFKSEDNYGNGPYRNSTAEADIGAILMFN